MCVCVCLCVCVCVTKPSIRDLWDRMFQLYKQEGSSGWLISGSRSRESQQECFGAMKLYIHRSVTESHVLLVGAKTK